MNKEKKNFFVSFLFHLFLLTPAILLPGCSSKAPNSGKILLRWSGYGAAGYDQWRAEDSKRFEQLHPGIKVKYEPVHQQYQPKILTQLASGTAPDVFFCAELQTYIEKGALVDISEWVKGDKDYFDTFFPGLLEDHTFNGRVYALHQNVAVGVLYYNKDLFDKERLAYPDETWTWSDLLRTAQRLTKRDQKGKVIQYGIVTPLEYQQMMLYIFQNGGRLWSEDGNRCVVNSPQAKEALTFWSDLIFKYQVAPSKYAMTTAAGAEYSGYSEIFFMGKAAMYLGGSYEVVSLHKHRMNWGVTLMPVSKKGVKRLSPRIYNSFGVWTGSKHPKEAYELMKFMTTPEVVKRLVATGDSLPLHTKGADMDLFLSDPIRPEPARKVMLTALKSSKSLYRLLVNLKVSYITQEKVLKEEFENLVFGKSSVPDVLRKIEARLNELLKKKEREA